MPSKKQRRRQQKLRRHEWEEVFLDEEGNEVEPPPELVDGARRRDEKRAGARAASTPRGVQPPSWRRVLKRGALFAPLMFLMIHFLEQDQTIGYKLLFAGQLLVIFVPFSYFVDVMSYRVWRKRMARDGQAAAKSR